MFDRVKNGKVIMEYRKQLKKTQKDIASECGVNKAVLSQIENGKFTGSLKIYERYINVLGLELSVTPIINKIPDFDELGEMFDEDE